MHKRYLMTPGPTPLPPQVREALGRPLIHHRTPEYRAIFRRVIAGMQQVMRTANPIACLTSSGTGGMEAAVANLLSPGDEALIILGGKFAERWEDLCRAYGATAHPIPVAYGDAVDPAAVADALKAHPKAKAVFGTLSETSTGVCHDIQAVAAITRESRAVLIVDAISGLAADPCETDAWGVDVVITGSQKALMVPPGLTFMSISERAWSQIESCTTPRYYFDLRHYRKAWEQEDAPFTPAIALVRAQEEALSLILSEGLDRFLGRTAQMAQAMRAAAEAMGLEVFAKRPSNGMTAICVPEGVEGRRLPELIEQHSGVRVAGGQGSLASKIFRVAHMGYISSEDVLVAVAAIEAVLSAQGVSLRRGAGVSAAKEVFEQTKIQTVGV